MAKGEYTRIARNIKLHFDIVTAARLARAAERDETKVAAMLEGFIGFNIDLIDPQGASDYVAPADDEEGEQP
jgi:hypothetical protein